MFRRFALALLISLGISLPASATSFSVDYTDLWFNRNEAGWGVNLSQQGNTMFATLFVYGPDQTPRWYVASSVVGTSSQTFTGRLYRTTGPYFGAAWTGGGPAIDVGSMSFNFNTPTTGTMTYSVDNVNVTKSIERQTFAANNLAGAYQGGLAAVGSGCNPASANGPILVFNLLNVTHSAANQVSMIVDFFTGNAGAAARCTFNGTYTQAGKLGNVAGTWNCTTGNAGAFTVSEIDVSLRGWSGRFVGSDQFCQYNGNFGGVRDVF